MHSKTHLPFLRFGSSEDDILVALLFRGIANALLFLSSLFSEGLGHSFSSLHVPTFILTSLSFRVFVQALMETTVNSAVGFSLFSPWFMRQPLTGDPGLTN